VTRIRASCPDCGEVDLLPDDVTLRVVRAEDGLVADGSSYRFCCPACAGIVSKPADERIAQLLTTGGVAVEDDVAAWALPITPAHPEAPPGGPRFTADDVLDLHLLLAKPDWFGRLRELTT